MTVRLIVPGMPVIVLVGFVLVVMPGLMAVAW